MKLDLVRGKMDLVVFFDHELNMGGAIGKVSLILNDLSKLLIFTVRFRDVVT